MITACRYSPALVLVAVLLFAIPPAEADPVEELVTAIRAEYNRIEGASLRSDRIEFESRIEPVAGTLTRYFDGDVLVKANLAYSAGDHGGSDETFYYRDGQPFFVYVSRGYWSFTGRPGPDGHGETEDTLIEHRLYFAGGHLIRHLRKEVKAAEPDALAGLIRKEANRAYSDPEYAAELQRRGLRLRSATSAAAIEQTIVE